MFLIVMVCFVMVMFLWLLSNLKAIPGTPDYSPWMAFFACLLLGIAVFAGGAGIAFRM
jgi:hypothetical protein